MSYIAKKSCGCIIAACVDEPKYNKETAKDLASWIKKGYTIERVKTEFARLNLARCNHDINKK